MMNVPSVGCFSLPHLPPAPLSPPSPALSARALPQRQPWRRTARLSYRGPPPAAEPRGLRAGLVAHLETQTAGGGVKALATKPLRPRAEVSALGETRGSPAEVGGHEFPSQAGGIQRPHMCPQPWRGRAVYPLQPRSGNHALVRLGY